jgi:hypothetical protein
MSVCAFQAGAQASTRQGSGNSVTTLDAQVAASKFVPRNGRTLLILGQDLDSVAGYVAGCERCPAPGGVTMYLGFYRLLDAASNYGGLGEDIEGHPAPDADWGAGISSAARAARTYSHSALILGLDISNGERSDGLAQIARGEHDDKIRRLGTFCARQSRPIYLRIGYEFDGIWNQGYKNHEQYRAAYRRIVDVMRASGATNVAYVWQASASPLDDILENGARERIQDWYPGPNYVDWMALSWFLAPEAHPTTDKVQPPTQRELANELVALARSEGKPVMIAESTPQGYDLTGLSRANISPIWNGPSGANVVARNGEQIWNEWYRPLFDYVRANRDVIRALAYINARWDDQPMWSAPYASGYWGDSRIQANETIETRWLREIGAAPWLHGGASLFEALGYSSATPADK